MSNNYQRAVFITRLKKDKEGALSLDLPFRTTHITLLIDNHVVTSIPTDGVEREVIAYVGYDLREISTNEIKKISGYLGDTWDAVKTQKPLTDRYTVTKAQALSTINEFGVETKYEEADKNELHKFWSDGQERG